MIKPLGWLLLAVMTLALVAVVVDSFGTLPKYVLEHSTHIAALTPAQLISAESNIRGSLLQAVGGILLVAGAITAWRQMLIGRKQHFLDRHIAVTDAFAKAVGNLGDK